MKKILSAILIMAAFTANSQVVDTSITRVTAVKIDTFYIQKKFPDVGKDTATHLGIWLMFDNLKSEAKLQITLCNKERNIVVFDEVLDGEAYKLWNGNNTYPFVFIANKYGLTFKNN